jgi:hypothetical protein
VEAKENDSRVVTGPRFYVEPEEARGRRSQYELGCCRRLKEEELSRSKEGDQSLNMARRAYVK